MNRVDAGVCLLVVVEVSRYISVVSQRDIYVKERYVSSVTLFAPNSR